MRDLIELLVVAGVPILLFVGLVIGAGEQTTGAHGSPLTAEELMHATQIVGWTYQASVYCVEHRPENTEDRVNVSVSTGTMRAQDLIPSFIGEISDILEDRSLTPKLQDPRLHGILDSKLGDIERRMRASTYWESEDVIWDLESLFDILDDLSPEGCHFGANKGDGSDYGFWESEPATPIFATDAEWESQTCDHPHGTRENGSPVFDYLGDCV